MRKWRIEDSVELYNIDRWGVDYFGINAKGNVYVKPNSDGSEIDLMNLITELNIRDVSTPVLLRFPEIIENRIKKFSKCFDTAKKEYAYKANHYIVYPIKVNQTSHVVEEIMSQGGNFNIGLEAGSKPELHAVLAVGKNPKGLIICNGYKDEDYIELALLAQKMGKRIFIVIEKLNELELTIKIAARLKVKPNIGIRIKLSSPGSGKWEDSGGDQSKFGLNSSELIEAIDIIKQNKYMLRVKLIHFHLGSQITNIRKIKIALREASQFYVQLKKLGCDIEFVDIGGGLGVNYDGFRSIGTNSVNYSIQEYVNDAVATMVEASDNNSLPHPNIITESGRALTAHHSMLVFDVLEKTSQPQWDDAIEIAEDEHELLKELHEIYKTITKTGMFEAWHDAVQIREESLDLFGLGMLDLRTRALIERLYWTMAREVAALSEKMKHQPSEVRRMLRMLADKYYCNFSLFQSLPDSWAIDQVFPIMPIHRLQEKPDRAATLQDLTCDSDGKIEQFIGLGSSVETLSLHNPIKGKPYYIAVFLVGAYQEILGDLHNLFGDTNAVHITTKNDGYEIKQVIDGETISDVLSYVQFDSKKLVRSMEAWVAKSVKAGKISQKEGKEFLSNYRSGLYGYTYLEKE